MKRIKGTAVSSGIAIGSVFHFIPKTIEVVQKSIISPHDEWDRLQSAFDQSEQQLQSLQEQHVEQLGENTVAILGAQKAVLHDPELHQRIRENVFEHGKNIELAVASAIDDFIQLFEKMDNPYMRERVTDLKDVRQRILANLQSANTVAIPLLQQPAVLIAEDLSPSDTVQLNIENVLGLCIANGGATSHTATLARTLGIPAIVGAGQKILNLDDDETVILDGFRGEVLISPNATELADYKAQREHHSVYFQKLLDKASDPAVTIDGKQITVAGNANRQEDVDLVVQNGAEGIGLLRTEFLYMQRQSLPTEDDLFNIYANMAKCVAPHPLIVRALDIGGDKPLPYLPMPTENNPFLGNRGIRLLLDQPDLLRTGLRALLRANSQTNNIKLMLPMISQMEEVKAVLQEISLIRDSSKSSLSELEVGIMIETPAAALIADRFADWVDFFSIGTNDLAQYTLAVDRGNEQVAYLYDAMHPSVLRLIAQVVKIAHTKKRWVGVCGDLASHIDGVALLIGLGVDELSASPMSIPSIKSAIRNLKYADVSALSKVALEQNNAHDVRQLFAQWHDVELS